jgi:hypothetical protein
MLAMIKSFTAPQTYGVNARRFEVEDFARTLLVFSLLGFTSKARSWQIVVSLSPIRSVR